MFVVFTYCPKTVLKRCTDSLASQVMLIRNVPDTKVLHGYINTLVTVGLMCRVLAKGLFVSL